jgi:hypothetical protein
MSHMGVILVGSGVVVRPGDPLLEPKSGSYPVACSQAVA